MPLTFAERRKYLRDRVVNATRMLTHGNFRLFRDSLVFEINHVKNLFKMWWHSKTEALTSDSPDSAFVNKARLVPPSWRPTIDCHERPELPHDNVKELASELREIRLSLSPRDADKKKSKWPKLPF